MLVAVQCSLTETAFEVVELHSLAVAEVLYCFHCLVE